MGRRVTLLIGSLIFAAAHTPIPSAGADPSNYQYVRTVSGLVRCVVSSDWVHCERGSIDGFPQAPAKPDGGHFNNAHVTAGGTFNWSDSNIGGASIDNDVVLDYGKTYRFHGWTILPNSDGTRFTNDATGHGMFVSIQDVHSF